LQKYFDPEYSPIYNTNLCNTLIDISRSNPFGKFDMQKMRNILSKSKLFANNDISILEISTWTIQIMKLLLFEYPRRLV
jgi:hypothetical protein